MITVLGSCFDVCRHIPHFIKSCVSINKECDISLDDWAGKFDELVNVNFCKDKRFFFFDRIL